MLVQRGVRKALRRLAKIASVTPSNDLPLHPPLPLPDGYDEVTLYAYLSSVRVSDAPELDMADYCRSDFRRFVYTWSLAADRRGKALELGANPYFTTMLLDKFTQLELTLANYFTEQMPPHGEQSVFVRERAGAELSSRVYTFDHFNIENDRFPYEDGSFDVVLFCEILEHLLMDPVRVLSEIRRILRPEGELILTTPNVSRLENVARMISGANIYDPYSGFGPYGRHNREYNKHELHLLLTYTGFTPETMFSADVHPNGAYAHVPEATLNALVKARQHDLGQYLFVRARRSGTPRDLRPNFLYRSLAATELEPWPA